ncbi:FemAB family XrtA/PEP-CTERM system-associated protein [Oxalobacteraceae bacterium A2-2]
MSAEISVRVLASGDHGRWDAFVQSCPDATFFHRAGWQRVIERAFGHRTWFLYAEAAGSIVGVLPLAQVYSPLFGHRLCSLPFCVYGGVAAASEAEAIELDRAAQALAARLRVGHLELRNRRLRHPDRLGQPLYHTFRKDLLTEPDRNLLAIPRKQRAMVRKGQAAGLRSDTDPEPARLHRCFAASVHRLGTPVFALSYFRLLLDEFGPDCRILTVTHGRQDIASVLSFRFRDEILPYYGGGLASARAVAGNDYMYWEVMRRACEEGCTLFDFGRSKAGTGAYEFKRHWGFEPQLLPYEYQLHGARRLPDNNALSPRFQLLVRAWRRLPLPVANVLGPHLVRQLG